MQKVREYIILYLQYVGSHHFITFTVVKFNILSDDYSKVSSTYFYTLATKIMPMSSFPAFI